MRNALVLLTSVSLSIACSSSTTTNNEIDGGAQQTGGRTGTTGIGGGTHSTGASTNHTTAGMSSVGGAATGGITATSVSGGGTLASGGSGAVSGGAATGGQRTGGGSVATGGVIAAGGTHNTAGSVAVGGSIAAGGLQTTGTMAAGGTIAAGGSSVAVGGAIGTGGVVTTGGSRAVGGTLAAGGSVVTGGAIATGGAVVTGGAIATGGLSTTTTGTTCTGQTKLCNGSCIPQASCCGGCSGNTPVCSNGTCVGKPNGDTCSSQSECASNVCADGVCCDVACDGQCEACNLSTSKGTCSPSTTARANNPCATDGSICGGSCDGTPAHRKACVYPSNQTSCGAGASCNTSTNQASTAQLCNGSGLCKAPDIKNCTPYSCNGTVCGTSCPSGQGVCGGTCVDIQSDPAHCGGACVKCSSSSPRCYSGACVQCTMGSDCVNLGYGNGSVCTSNHSCQCRPPSSGNLLANPGFDGSLSGWTLRNCPSNSCPSSIVDYSTSDAESCPGSGSVRLFYYGFEFGAAIQCVPADPNKSYRFGFSYKQVATTTGAIICYINYYAGSTCSGDSLDSTSLASTNVPSGGGFSTELTTFFTPASTGSIQVMCQNNSGYDAWMDQVYINGSGGYF